MRPLKCLLVLCALLLCACSTAAPPERSGAAASSPASEVPQPSLPASAVVSEAGEVDYSCSTDADCAVKDVGNCCGYYPACVNVDSPTFPERVKAQCEKEGMSSVCGFPAIESCVCKTGRCEAAAQSLSVE